ncbi:hypothetical protein T4B_2844 [Trichinella pseudospiralis]|uniref:Uncharacterized protein n=2 Tax=Trichinella pseudospiralis TaxID=6337 RepID=A0A0V1IP38_TRIPS|nr:hypothetical protein T4D_11849 [Trichinella pseudospiralis]KRZ24576.1 hypothetical protein T4B_2844 [Trichinella pseudospiralis]
MSVLKSATVRLNANQRSVTRAPGDDCRQSATSEVFKLSKQLNEALKSDWTKRKSKNLKVRQATIKQSPADVWRIFNKSNAVKVANGKCILLIEKLIICYSGVSVCRAFELGEILVANGFSVFE